MNKAQQIALSAFIREQKLSVADIREALSLLETYGTIPEIDNGTSLPLELRYADNTVSKTFVFKKPATAVHPGGRDVSLHDAPVQLQFDDAVKFCRQQGGHLPTSADCVWLNNQRDNLNTVLETVSGNPLRDELYWLGDKLSSLYNAKAVNLATGKIIVLPKRRNLWVRPML